MRVGQSVTLMVRPECIWVGRRDGCENRVEGHIRDVVYHGDHVRLCIEVDHLGTLVARHPIAEDGAEYEPGQTLPVCWSVRNLHAFPG